MPKEDEISPPIPSYEPELELLIVTLPEEQQETRLDQLRRLFELFNGG